MGRDCSIVFGRRQGQAVPVAGFDNSGSESKNRLRGSRLVLEVQDRLLSQEDQQLPFPRHVAGSGKAVDFVEDPVALRLVRPEEVVVGDPERDIVVRAVVVVVAALDAVGLLVGTVQAFDQLLERPELRGDGIVVGKADDLRDLKVEIAAELDPELLCSKDIRAVAIGNELELFRELFDPAEGHAHGKDAGTDGAVIGDLVADDRAREGVYDQPEEALHSADLDVGLVPDEGIAFFVGIVVHKGLDAQGCSPRIVGDLLVGYVDPV